MIDEFLDALRVTSGPWGLDDHGAIRRLVPRERHNQNSEDEDKRLQTIAKREGRKRAKAARTMLYSRHQCPLTAVADVELSRCLDLAKRLRLSNDDLYDLAMACDNWLMRDTLRPLVPRSRVPRINMLRRELLRVTTEAEMPTMKRMRTTKGKPKQRRL